MSSPVFKYPNKISLANIPTPLTPLDRLSEKYGGPRIWLKRDDLTGSTLSGNKVRKLEYVIAEALDTGADSLITCGGLQSNHCRATAMVGAQLGLDVHLLLREGGSSVIDGNLLMDHLAGAKIDRIDRKTYFSSLSKIFKEKQNQLINAGKTPYLIPTGASDEVGIWGYISCVSELIENFQNNHINPDLIVCATGSGGTQAGLTLGASLYNLKAQVLSYAVCDNAEYFASRVKDDVNRCLERYGVNWDVNRLSINTNDSYIGPGYAKGYPELFSTIQEVCRLEGVLLDPVYTGKAFHGLLTDIKLGKFSDLKDVIFIHTGGIFGVFPYRSQFKK